MTAEAAAAAAADEVVEEIRPAGAWTVAWRRLRRDRLALVSGGVLLFVLFAVFPGATIAAHAVGHGPDAIFPYGAVSLKPVGLWAWVPDTEITVVSVKNLPKTLLVLGADGSLGRDELLRLLYGGRVSIEVALGATLLAVCIGATLGAVAAYFGGMVDGVISRFTDLVMAFPLLLFLIVLGSTATGDKLTKITFGGVLKPGVFSLVVLIGGFTWFYPARIVRARILSLREREFVQAAAMVGASDARIIRKHLVPHLIPALTGYALVALATNILLEAGVSFLGAGVEVPAASWGNMLGTTWGTLANPTPYSPATFSIWPTVLPSLAIFLTVLAFNHFGESVREALDPQGIR